MSKLRSIDLNLAPKLERRGFRDEWFQIKLEESVPEQFRELRERRGLTQSELADAAETKQSMVSRLEKSHTPNWQVSTLLKLSRALDAQLKITLEPAEEVIAKQRKIESQSVNLDAASQMGTVWASGTTTQTSSASPQRVGAVFYIEHLDNE
ncbi:helix-turn-helix domain-containing protein [Pelagibius sp. Alg239-R121]|uniref:helix-turn-helix domain-containing protein n=1 Tax=Pelagibius sp. Alg239-R121 TaxID=2993448 RepID=UPI0024A63AE0|nr:helix-turn-helix transcriptional regulator [Pelagibius sp. Alg239-R121]